MNDPNLAMIIANMTPAERQAALAALGGGSAVVPGVSGGPTGQIYKLWSNYYSIVRFQAIVAVSAPVTTLTFQAVEQRPFNYRIGDNLSNAGFDPAFGVATDAETNLVKANETVAGEQLQVYGISLMPSSITDIGLWKKLIANMSVNVSMDGGAQNYKLGRPDMIPGSGGTFGSGYTPTVVPPLDASIAADSSFSNGWPTNDNFYPFPQPLIWSPSGSTDSNFQIVLRLVRQLTFAETARAAATGIAAFTPPTATGDFGTYIDIMCRLHSKQMAARSVNQ
jgi:hypothetical protein